MNIHELNRHIKTALAKGGTIKLSLAETLLVITINKEKKVNSRLYKKGTFVKSYQHLATSAQELGKALMEIVFVIHGGLSSLGQLVGLMKRKPLQIEYLPKDDMG